jgi:hypothetical protein
VVVAACVTVAVGEGAGPTLIVPSVALHAASWSTEPTLMNTRHLFGGKTPAGAKNVRLLSPLATPSNVMLNSAPEPPARGVKHAPATCTSPGVVRLGTARQLA